MTAADAKPDTSFDPRTPLEPSRALAPYAVKVNASLVRRRFWPKLRRVVRHIPFAEDVVALWFVATDRRTPATTKGMLFAALAYFVLPTDAIPDILPAIGFTDDAAVIAMALTLARSAIKPEHREAARAQIERLAGGDAEAAPAEA